MPQPELKVGDRVRCIARDSSDVDRGPRIGQLGTITRIMGGAIMCRWDGLTTGHDDCKGTDATNFWGMLAEELALAVMSDWRMLRLWHWRQCSLLRTRAKLERDYLGRPNQADRYDRQADFHLRAVQLLKDCPDCQHTTTEQDDEDFTP